MRNQYVTLECRVCRESYAVHLRSVTEETAKFQCSACGSRIVPRQSTPEATDGRNIHRFFALPTL
jgi:DNA-directed RNA polymerase subunit RPC12/RpoP